MRDVEMKAAMLEITDNDRRIITRILPFIEGTPDDYYEDVVELMNRMLKALEEV